MTRWPAGTRRRLQVAALDLFAAHGYDGVTVARIAAAAGLTERTFFRWFADKREVLFTDDGEFESSFTSALDGATPLGRIESAVLAAARAFPADRRAMARLRQRVIDADARLRERELLKLAALTSTLARAVAADGTDPIDAGLAAEHGVAVFRIAFAAWIAEGEDREMAAIAQDVLDRARALAADG